MNKDTVQTIASVNRYKVTTQGQVAERDDIPLEEPLLIQCCSQSDSDLTDFSMTLRTPGHDPYLVHGLLFAEGIIEQASDICAISAASAENANLIQVRLNRDSWQRFRDSEATLSRRYPSYGGCGLCGKTHLQALELKSNRSIRSCRQALTIENVRQMRHRLAVQPLFAGTGGVHVAGFIPLADHVLQWAQARFFEDIGRHNALDKLTGAELTDFNLEREGVLLLSGRVGFELVQKAVMAGFGTIVALGAPSQLAVQAALRFGICLAGFAKDHQYNLYSEGG